MLQQRKRTITTNKYIIFTIDTSISLLGQSMCSVKLQVTVPVTLHYFFSNSCLKTFYIIFNTILSLLQMISYRSRFKIYISPTTCGSNEFKSYDRSPNSSIQHPTHLYICIMKALKSTDTKHFYILKLKFNNMF